MRDAVGSVTGGPSSGSTAGLTGSKTFYNLYAVRQDDVINNLRHLRSHSTCDYFKNTATESLRRASRENSAVSSWIEITFTHRLKSEPCHQTRSNRKKRRLKTTPLYRTSYTKDPV